MAVQLTGSVPIPAVRMLGRDEDLVKLQIELDQYGTRLITLVGPPGVGKTLLAQHLAVSRGATYQHGAAFVALDFIQDVNLVPARLMHSLGLREPVEPTDSGKRPREDLSDIGLLNEVASLTGGKLYLGNTPQQIAEAVSHIEDDLRAQYLIGFAPTGKGAVKYRTISLKISGRAQAVRVRAGYLGTEPPLVASRNKHTERKGS